MPATIYDRDLDKNRAGFDVTHSFAANFLWPLPFGRDRAIGRGANAFVDKLIGGWNVQGLTRWASGAPFTISSGRLTTGALGGATAVLRNMTSAELRP